MRSNLFEAFMGAVVLLVAVVFLFYAFSVANFKGVEGYEVFAEFDRIDGLSIGSDVRMSGIKVGTVVDQRLDTNTYLAEVRFKIDSSINIPVDSSAQIVSDGLLGSKFLSIVPGSEEDLISPGGKVVFTQSSVILENLIGQFLFGTNSSEGDDN